MKKSKVFLSLVAITGFLFSCTVTNNLYVNDPVPMGKGVGKAYIGVGTGIEAHIDSVSMDGTVNFSDKISSAPVLCFGLQAGILNRMDIRFGLHLPYIVGGIGARLGVQYSLIEADSKFHLAVGTDLGFTSAKDSIKFLGSKSEVNRSTNGALHGDLFIPFSIKLTDNFSVILTPRYSINALWVRKNENWHKGERFDFSYPAITLGLRIYNFYLETTAMYYDNKINPFIGAAWLMPLNDTH